MPIWYILYLFGIFYGDLGYFMPIWYILYLFGIFFPGLVSCTKKNLATMVHYVNSKMEAFHSILPSGQVFFDFKRRGLFFDMFAVPAMLKSTAEMKFGLGPG
jgi:hypothetical protein